MKNRINDPSEAEIVKEKGIYLSDEKLRAMLARSYERAQEDEETFKLYKFYGVFLSIAGTLFLTLLTASFSPIGNLSAKDLTTLAWIVCIICAVLGFILMGIFVSTRKKSNTKTRDHAVNELYAQSILKN